MAADRLKTTLATILALGAISLALPGAAEAQNRGVVQVSARVVDTRTSFQGLETARQATVAWGKDGSVAPSTSRDGVTDVRVAYTPAQVANERRTPGALVVTIEYSRS
jgi:hypothetical protein